MAIKATIFKADLQFADMDRNYYAEHSLTLARHPSETDERMMVRLLAFAMFAHPQLGFGKGMCVEDEADLWQKDLTGAIELWIDVGLPDEKRVRRIAVGGTDDVVTHFAEFLPKRWQSLVFATFPMEMTASHDQVLAKALTVGEQTLPDALAKALALVLLPGGAEARDALVERPAQ